MLDLEKELPRPVRLNFWPFVDILAIGLFFALFSTKFVMAPGLILDLPEVDDPQVATSSVYEVMTVTEVKGEEMIFYQNSVLNLESLGRLMAGKDRPPKNATLLVKADTRVSMQTLSELTELAIAAGYARLQLATEEAQSVGDPF